MAFLSITFITTNSGVFTSQPYLIQQAINLFSILMEISTIMFHQIHTFNILLPGFLSMNACIHILDIINQLIIAMTTVIQINTTMALWIDVYSALKTAYHALTKFSVNLVIVQTIGFFKLKIILVFQWTAILLKMDRLFCATFHAQYASERKRYVWLAKIIAMFSRIRSALIAHRLLKIVGNAFRIFV